MKLYKFNKFNESTESIESICRKYNITNYNIDNGLVNVDGDVIIQHIFLDKLPLNFGEVAESFYCNHTHMTTLQGSPRKVGGSFNTCWNYLTDLNGSPKIIGGYFNCANNRITSLVGGPEEVWGVYNCSNNHLTDVIGIPEYYRGKVSIYNNPVYEIINLFLIELQDEGSTIDIIIETLNDYNVIRPGNKVNLQLLKYSFDELNILMPEIKYIRGYEII